MPLWKKRFSKIYTYDVLKIFLLYSCIYPLQQILANLGPVLSLNVKTEAAIVESLGKTKQDHNMAILPCPWGKCHDEYWITGLKFVISDKNLRQINYPSQRFHDGPGPGRKGRLNPFEAVSNYLLIFGVQTNTTILFHLKFVHVDL